MAHNIARWTARIAGGDHQDPPAAVLLPGRTTIDDATVESATPDTNFGSDATVAVDLTPLKKSYLKFTVAGTSGQITSATLKLYNTNDSTQGGDIHRVPSNAWDESTITWNNAPATSSDPALDTLGPVVPGNTYSLDVIPGCNRRRDLLVRSRSHRHQWRHLRLEGRHKRSGPRGHVPGQWRDPGPAFRRSLGISHRRRSWHDNHRRCTRYSVGDQLDRCHGRLRDGGRNGHDRRC